MFLTGLAGRSKAYGFSNTRMSETSNFPTTANAFQPSYGKGSDGFVVKFSPEGAAIYSSYLGGRRNDQISGIAVDPAGNVYVTGDTSSKDFPTRNALQPVISRSSDAFVAKIID
jgi:beta-propeller repeat-containing protein